MTEVVPLDMEAFDSKNPGKGLMHTCHELVHRITPGLLDAKKGRTWDGEILNILGVTDLRNVGRALDESISKKRAERKTAYWAKSKNFSLDEYFVDRLDYSLVGIAVGRGGSIPVYREQLDEWIAVMGELYLRGRSFFVPQYSRFFDSGIANSLYDFTKTKIYRNAKEYEKFPYS